MITTEQILAIDGGWIRTTGGNRRAAGNALHKVGDSVTVCGDLVLGWRRRTAPPLPAPWPEDKRYRFADASTQTMYFVDEDFAIVDQLAIDPPEENAYLILHVYDENAEYLVWNVDMPNSDYDHKKYIIQTGNSNGTFETLGSFVEYVSERIDAIIDAGDLLLAIGAVIRVNEADAKQTVFLIKYRNLQKASSGSFSESVYMEAFYQSCKDDWQSHLSNALVQTTLLPVETKATQYQFPKDNYVYGTMYKARVSGMDTPDSAMYMYPSSTHVALDVWGNKSQIEHAVGIGGHVILYISATDTRWNGEQVDSSYSTPIIYASCNYLGVFLLESGAEMDLYIEPGNNLTETQNRVINNALVTTAADGLDAPDISVTVGTASNNLHHGTPDLYGFWAGVIESDYDKFFGGMPGPAYNFRGTDGGNEGIVRAGRVEGWNRQNHLLQLDFASPWDAIPAVGSVFVAENMEFATETDNFQYANYSTTVSATQSETSSLDSNGIVTELGNGYTWEYIQMVGNAYGWMRFYCVLKYNGDIIYTGEEYEDFLEIAWMISGTILKGISPRDKMISADAGLVTIAEISISSGIVTKRFV